MNWHHNHRHNMKVGDRFAEWISRRIGSPLSIFLHTAAFVACFEAVWLQEVPLEQMLLWLTTVVSLEAIYIGLFLQNSSNRHGDEAEHQAWADFQTNIESKFDIEQVMQNLARIEDLKLDAILRILVEPTLKARKRAKHVKRK